MGDNNLALVPPTALAVLERWLACIASGDVRCGALPFDTAAAKSALAEITAIRDAVVAFPDEAKLHAAEQVARATAERIHATVMEMGLSKQYREDGDKARARESVLLRKVVAAQRFVEVCEAATATLRANGVGGGALTDIEENAIALKIALAERAP